MATYRESRGNPIKKVNLTMSEEKKSYTYITILHVALYVVLVPLILFIAANSWSKSGNDSSGELLLLDVFILIGFPIVGFVQYLFFKNDNLSKATAYRAASLIELCLIMIGLFMISNIGR